MISSIFTWLKRINILLGKSIQTRLLYSFVLAALVPAFAISIGSIIFGTLNASQKSIEQLESLIALKEMNINTWLDMGQNELVMTLNEPYVLERLQAISALAGKIDYYEYYKNGALFRVSRYLQDSQLLKEIFLLDLKGDVLLTTDLSQEGKNYQSLEYFQQGLKQTTSGIVQNLQIGPGYQMIVTCPVYDLNNKVTGELLGVIKPETLPAIMSNPLLQGDSATHVYLVDSSNTLYDSLRISSAEVLSSKNVHSRGIDAALEKKDSGFLVYMNQAGTMVYGVRRWIPELNMALIVEKDLTSVLGDLITNQFVNLVIILLGIALAVVISLYTSKRIATPILNLSHTAARVASGDFQQTVDIRRKDEIGVLADSFNSMTIQLRGLVEDLEMRVEDRTAELQESNQRLEKRAIQMETTFQVSREITSILDIDMLLLRIVNLIKEAFAYSHVSIYLLEQCSNQLIWRAGDSSQVGESCSELVIALKMGEKMIGRMNVSHMLENAFSPEDLRVLEGLGDQIAIAINNALLYEKIQKLAVLEERSRMARELHDSINQLLYSQVLYADASKKYITSGQPGQAVEYVQQLQESAHQALKEMRLMIYELRPSILEAEGLWGAVKHRLETVEQRSGLEARLQGNPDIKLPPEMEKEMYLIAQEALNNVLKHSRCSRVEVLLGVEEEKVIMLIQDNGVGFKFSKGGGGLGLNSIQEHAQRMGGVCSIEATPGQGTKITVCIPQGAYHD